MPDEKHFDVSVTMDELNQALDKIFKLALNGCRVDGSHHKQYYLEQIMDTLGYNVSAVRGDEWEPGIPE